MAPCGAVLAQLNVVRRGQIFSLEYRIVRADGTLAWVLERGQQVRDSRR